jgi:hypothetical protein
VQFGSVLRESRRGRGLSLRGLQALIRYDFTYLGQVERGEKPGSLALATACDDALTAGGELITAFRASTSSLSVSGAAPSRGVTSVSVRNDLEALRALYHGTYSIEGLSQAVSAYLAENSQRLREARGNPARRRLLSERADAALLAGRLALFDTWIPVAARGWLALACEAAVEAGDDALAAGAYGHLAFVSAREELTRASTEYLGAARRHAERACIPALTSWVGAVEAEILGPLRPDGGLRALDEAVRVLDSAAAAPTPPWFDFYSPARLDGFRGQALLAAGRGEAAREALSAALADLEPDAVKQRAVLLADLAASHLCDRSPDLEQAAAEAMRAAVELGRTQYQAAAERLAVLRERLEPWQSSAVVRDLDDVLAGHAHHVA